MLCCTNQRSHLQLPLFFAIMAPMNKLGTEKINKLLVTFALPSVVSLVLNAIYNMVDQIFIGQGVGYLANAATNVVFPLTQLAVALGLLFGDGTASFMNLRLGEKDRKSASRGTAAGITAIISVAVILLIVYNLLLEPLCWLFGATEGTIDYALQYGKIISLGIPFCIFSCGTSSIMRADSSPGIAMMGLVSGCIVNLIGDPLAIFVLNLGVRGAALATIAGQCTNMIINIWYLLRRVKSVDLDADARKACSKFIPTVARLGFSSFVTQVAVVFVMAVQNNLLTIYGAQSEYGADVPLAALGVTMKVFTILQSAIAGMMAGAQPILSFNYGSRQISRVRETLRKTMVIAILIMGIATIWFQFAPMSIVRLFGSNDALYNQFAVLCLRVFLALIVLDAVQMVATPFLQAIGKPGPAALLIFFRQLVIQIPAMFLLGAIFGVMGLLYAGPVSSFLVFILSVIFLVRERGKLQALEQ